MGLGASLMHGQHTSSSSAAPPADTPPPEYVVDDGASVGSEDTAERERAAESAGRSSRIVDASTATPPPASLAQEPLSSVPQSPAVGRVKGSSMSGGAGTEGRGRVPPSERMLRFSPNDEVKYYERHDEGADGGRNSSSRK
jgi:hypothetical protein